MPLALASEKEPDSIVLPPSLQPPSLVFGLYGQYLLRLHQIMESLNANAPS